MAELSRRRSKAAGNNQELNEPDVLIAARPFSDSVRSLALVYINIDDLFGAVEHATHRNSDQEKDRIHILCDGKKMRCVEGESADQFERSRNSEYVNEGLRGSVAQSNYAYD